ncbi:MAG: prepilin-type N-terminal cleavage/methylation domain-containing protein [Rhodospirillales bacterium]|nr:prepilin-type N-terminal cleavage/methylation domain-containing protein [Rhodospirillales bacterium]
MLRSLNKLKRSAPEAGFTLVEVLVAFVILSVFLGVLYQTFSYGLRGSDNARQYSTAVLYAESLLADFESEKLLAEGESEGDLSDGFHWKTSVRALETNGESSVGLKTVTSYDVEVTVYWKFGTEVKSIALQTIRFGPEKE